MLFDSTLRKELARGFGATLVVILTIVITMMLIRTLGQAASLHNLEPSTLLRAIHDEIRRLDGPPGERPGADAARSGEDL